jgi:heat shock protein HslJ
MKIVIAALALALAACGTPGKEPPPRPFVGTIWEVVLDLPPAGEQPHFRFGDGHMDGFGGCSRIEAKVLRDTVGAGAIALGRIERGRRACERSKQDAEDHIVEVLQGVSSYTITGPLMTMSGSTGSLAFRAVEERKPAVEERKPSVEERKP